MLQHYFDVKKKSALGQLSTEIGVKIVSEYDQETPQSQTADNIICIYTTVHFPHFYSF